MPVDVVRKPSGGALPTRLIVLVVAMLATAGAQAAEGGRFERYGGITPVGLHAVGPPLTELRTKLTDPNWLVAWLLRPAHLRQRTLMRRFNLKVEEARAIARYLYGPEAPRPSTSVAWEGGDAQLGETLFVTRGCRGCHAIARTEASVSDRVPNLAGVGLKVRGDWLFNWLKSPRTYDPNTPMPQVVLSDEEIRHLVAFLLSRRDGAEALAHAPRFDRSASLEAGRTAITRFDCPKCHLIQGFQTITPTAAQTFLPRPCGPCHEPGGSAGSPAAPERAEAAAGGTDNEHERALRNGRLLVAFYNCHGCHRLEGSGGAIADYLERKTFAPPVLDGEGARVQTSWLIEFLQRPKPLRPWLQLRMPNYGFSPDEAGALARYFATLAHAAPVDEPMEFPLREVVDAGARCIAHFKCGQCHPAGAGEKSTDAPLPAGVDPEDLSIDLKLAKSRLRPSWVRDFLARPKAVAGMDTRMPTVFFTIDGEPKVEHPERDIEAITAYLFTMPEAPIGSAPGSRPPTAPETPAPDWRTYPY